MRKNDKILGAKRSPLLGLVGQLGDKKKVSSVYF
jgi:hypothetical protein